LQKETELTIEKSEEQVAQIDSLNTELATLKERHTALLGRTQQLETDAIRMSNELTEERRAAELARTELSKIELSLKAAFQIEKNMN